MLSETVIDGFTRNLEKAFIEYGVPNYAREIKQYWADKKQKKKCKKPTPIFDKKIILEIIRVAEFVEYYSKYNPALKDKINNYIKLSNEFIKCWKLYKQKV